MPEIHQRGYKPKTNLCPHEMGHIESNLKNVKKLENLIFKQLKKNTRERRRQTAYVWRMKHPSARKSETKAQKSKKAPGIDKILSKIYKLGGKHLAKSTIHALLTEIWKKETISSDCI